MKSTKAILWLIAAGALLCATITGWQLRAIQPDDAKPMELQPLIGGGSHREYEFDEPRDPRWRTVRRHVLEEHPACEACGSKRELNVHHVKPFAKYPELELEPSNLIVLCRTDHEVFGHLHDFTSWNINVRKDVEEYRKKVEARPK